MTQQHSPLIYSKECGVVGSKQHEGRAFTGSHRAFNNFINNFEDERGDMVIKFINDYTPERLINVRNKMQGNVYVYDESSPQTKFDW